jgi:hypothetical protein
MIHVVWLDMQVCPSFYLPIHLPHCSFASLSPSGSPLYNLKKRRRNEGKD